MRAFLYTGVLAIGLGLVGTTGMVWAQNSGYVTYPNGWAGYVPGYSWAVNPSTGWSGYVPTPPAAPAAPAPAVSGRSWTGYAPATAWQGQVPSGAWVGYVPAGGMRAAPAPRSRTRFYPPTYREYGTGRPVPQIKPWLPHSP